MQFKLGKRHRRTFSAMTLALAMSACTATVSTHGHPLDPEQLAQVKPGVTSREEVARLLGSPSTVGTFEQERWFYVSQRSEVMSFYKADVTQQDVVRIDFDANGIVSDVHTHGLELAQAVEPDPNQTRTMGNELTALRQILGNIGRFNTDPNQRTGAAGPGTPGGGGGF